MPYKLSKAYQVGPVIASLYIKTFIDQLAYTLSISNKSNKSLKPLSNSVNISMPWHPIKLWS